MISGLRPKCSFTWTGVYNIPIYT